MMTCVDSLELSIGKYGDGVHECAWALTYSTGYTLQRDKLKIEKYLNKKQYVYIDIYKLTFL